MSKTRTALPYRHQDPLEVQPGHARGYARGPIHDVVYDVPFEAKDSTSLGEIANLLRRHKWKIALCSLLGIAAGLGLALMTTPTYRARTSIQLEDFHDLPLLRARTVETALPGASVENYLQNQVKLLESETLARRVADQLGIRPEPAKPGTWRAFIGGIRERLSPTPPQTNDDDRARIAAVQKALTIRTSLQSQVIELYFDARTPQMAAAGANEAAAQFIDLNREAHRDMIAESTAWLTQQAEELKKRLDTSNARLHSFAASAGLVFAGKDDTLAQDRMRQLQGALVQAEADRAAKQSRYETVTKSGKLVSEAVADAIHRREEELQKMRQELSDLRTVFTPNHPKVTALEARIEETQKAVDEAREDAMARVKNDYVAAAGLERMLSDSQRRELQVIERQMRQQRQYDVMKSDADTTQRLYESVLENLKEAGAASSLRSTNARVMDAAAPPVRAYSPNLGFNGALGLAFGTLTGIGLVLLRGRSNKVAQPGETVLFNVPELGVIPSARHAWLGQSPNRLLPFRGKSEPGLVTWTHDASPLSESFRSTLNSILFGAFMNNAPGERGLGRILSVSSFDPMAGKTTVVSNLAVTAAERKLRVLVIDADLRRPRVHSLFNLTNDWGLTDVLEQGQMGDFIQTAPVESLVRSTHISNVSVLPAGPGTAAIPSLLYSSSLKALLQRFRTEFDLIFVDTPPIMLYSDARFLGRLSDGLVMVVRANTRSREELRTVFARLMDDRIPVLGTVLNGWEMDPHQSREMGAYYYRYQQPADRPA